jgi:hypothetical protein
VEEQRELLAHHSRKPLLSKVGQPRNNSIKIFRNMKTTDYWGTAKRT